MNDHKTDYNNPFFTRGCRSVPDVANAKADTGGVGCCKLGAQDWMSRIPGAAPNDAIEIVEVRFKNSKKEFFRQPSELMLEPGDIVAVEASPGHDLGIVSLTGATALRQFRKFKQPGGIDGLKKIYRRARSADVEKWLMAVGREHETMVKTRQISQRLGLNMKMNDVEYQGDGTKAIFYYTADDRVDFRELIKVLAEEFRVRIEMKQIGIRQEASRMGGIGSCGRELCCSTWLSRFRTVSTAAARAQQLSLNPQKLAGQCGKLKCCLNYEYDSYADALKDFPTADVNLKTRKGTAACQKIDVYKGLMWYSYLDAPNNFMAIPKEAVEDILKQNEAGSIPADLESFALTEAPKADFGMLTSNDDLHRFDK
ncbi:MAG: regulatory iron-sulfur-containing complex subunit RicT [Bacteroidales bacterium]|nr:regulatory iron-sulfur-containing complex subunit RicT [Bacteroidales bacterium]MDD3664930.1 regulatory iron-sulfur-containing complex subunit RicT [Bacteroidales bacterium]